MNEDYDSDDVLIKINTIFAQAIKRFGDVFFANIKVSLWPPHVGVNGLASIEIYTEEFSDSYSTEFSLRELVKKSIDRHFLEEEQEEIDGLLSLSKELREMADSIDYAIASKKKSPDLSKGA